MHVHIELELDLDGTPFTALQVTSVEGRERIGAPYCFTVQAVLPAGEGTLANADVLSATAILRFVERSNENVETTIRTVRGVVQSFEESLEESAGAASYSTYTFVVAPRLAELGRFVSQDVHVGKSYPEVVRAKLVAAQMTDGTDFAIRLKEPGIYGGSSWTDGDPDSELAQPRLVVQYAESDLAFISRLCEHVGISYFFEEVEDHEVVVFTDHEGGFRKREVHVPLRGSGDEHGLLSLSRKTSAISSDFYVYDYSYRRPSDTYEVGGERLFDVLGGESHLDVPSAGALVEYAPNAKTAAEATLLARVRADAEEGARERFIGRGPVPALYPGVEFRLDHCGRVDTDDDLLVVEAAHNYTASPGFMYRDAHAPTYSVELQIVRSRKAGPDNRVIPYRPRRTTPRPKIHGIVTGVVHSASHETGSPMQHIDAQGRYLIKLHFDQGTQPMPRVRMAQPHSGENYGHHFPLRPGAEVLVAFLDGDPDRPVIIGTAPHPLKGSPVRAPLSGEAVEVSRIRTRSGITIEFSDGPKG
ncbi:MAG: type VI secretion system tip protein VgrG [Polyangiaceae bacterium]|nr:type VI secretion system tip protein VgrG [Polyangiaceae bacterium]